MGRACCRVCGEPVGRRRRAFCSEECSLAGRGPGPWQTMDFPGAVVLYRKAKTTCDDEERYELEVRLLDGRVHRDTIDLRWTRGGVEDQLRSYLALLIQNLIDDPPDVVVGRMFNG